ncbi:MAG: DNA-directed RNA polymerase subunit beta', partial [Treponema sp.]|nr:DNA-directed RNA polymerase subunit beta' [Treponema sp.]
EVFAVLDEVVKEHPVLLNRAPTLHRLGIQAFEPVLVEGKAIKLHPLVCHAFNADFDGDQMAVHVPLTQAAQMECWTLMLSARNLLNPANGKTIVFPSQDMVLGINFLTRIKPNAKRPGSSRPETKDRVPFYSSAEEALMAVEARSLDWEAVIRVKPVKSPVWERIGVEVSPAADGTIETTAGRLVFNEEMPPEIPFVNYELKDKELRSLIEYVFNEKGSWITVKMLDAIKATGYRYSTVFGATIGIDDILVPKEKAGMIDKANKDVQEIQRLHRKGLLTQEERYNQVIEVWNKTNEDLTNRMMKTLEADRDGFNSIYMMANSGARGSRNQIRQLAGMRGLMAKPSGEIIELPIRSNFKEGLSVIEFFISTNGARKGLADTALKTAEAGYLTRRLVDIAQDVVVNEDDCGTINGISYFAVKDGEDIIEPLGDLIVGRYTLEGVKHPITGETIIDMNEEITREAADKIDAAGIETVRIRTVLTCEAKHGVCRKCYGRNLATNRAVEIGEAVGTIAAQSIGQPGTQLTMRTFHIGGTATKMSEENRISLKYPVYVRDIVGTYLDLEDGRRVFTRKGFVTVSKVMAEHKLQKGDSLLVENGKRIVRGDPIIRRGKDEIVSQEIAYAMILEDPNDGSSTLYLIGQDQKIEIRNGSDFVVKKGTVIEKEKTIATFDPFSDPIIAEKGGVVKYEDIILGTTLREEVDEETGNIERRITDVQLENKQPRILIVDENGDEVASYHLPGGAILQVENGDRIRAGRTIAKILKESARAMDITSGLPRVSELFEARKPRGPAELAKVSGTVFFQGIAKGKRKVMVQDEYGHEFVHSIPMAKRLLVRDGDTVEAGEPLCDGKVDPHDVLSILGESELQRYLMREIQEVYRLQGVSINDKHIGVIIRQMMRKVVIRSVGDTRFIYDQLVDKYKFHDENKRVIGEGGQPAIAHPVFQGITKASLNIDSFLSAASFQETTRVLTNAAIAGSSDYLRGLKENIIIGHPIPAGTGMKRYRDVKLYDEDSQDLDKQMNDILEQRRLEALAIAEAAASATLDMDITADLEVDD